MNSLQLSLIAMFQVATCSGSHGGPYFAADNLVFMIFGQTLPPRENEGVLVDVEEVASTPSLVGSIC